MSSKVAIVIGASRGIGRQIAIDLAKNGYTVVVAAKSVTASHTENTPPPDPNSPASTITTVAAEITSLGHRATPIQVDVRSSSSIKNLISQTLSLHGRIDTLVYNSGAIFWAPVSRTPLRRFQLMQSVNPEGLYATLQEALPHLPDGARVVAVCPPIYSRFFRGKTAYAVGKVGMSVLVLGLGMDFEREGRGRSITGLWPAAAIQSAATQQFSSTDPSHLSSLRKPSIFSDAILAILRAPSTGDINGKLLLDEDFLRDHAGVTDFETYSLVPGSQPRRIMPKKLPDLTVEEQDDEGKRYDQTAGEEAKKRGGSKL